MPSTKSFTFHTELRLVALTGVKALSVSDLRAALQKLPGSSVFYHTHQEYLAHNFEKPIYYNDFARWVHTALREEALAEKLTACGAKKRPRPDESSEQGRGRPSVPGSLWRCRMLCTSSCSPSLVG